MKKINEERTSKQGKYTKFFKGIDYNKRVERFWTDINGLVDLLNSNNKNYIVTSAESPIINSFLLWRVLDELKIFNLQLTKQNGNQ